MDFKGNVHRAFDYLGKYGYKRVESIDESHVCYSCDNNKVYIFYSNYSYEISCYFSDCTEKKSFYLQEALNYAGLNEYKGIYQYANISDIQKGIFYISSAVEKLFRNIDLSISDNFDIVFEYSQKKHEKALKDYYASEEIKKAENYWNRKMFKEALPLFKNNYIYLTKSQKKKIEIMEKNNLS